MTNDSNGSKYTYPATQEQALEWLAEFRAKTEQRHSERMKEWDKFATAEYDKELQQELLNETHPDTQPPWLKEGLE